MSDSVDYQALLDQLEGEREKLETMIQWVRGKLGQQSPSEMVGHARTTSNNNASEPTGVSRPIPSDAFFRMSVPTAIKAFLGMTRGPRPATVITDALKRGGLTTQAKNLYQTVYPTLLRMEKAGEVVRVGTSGDWGLAEWYPAGSRKGSSPVSASLAERERDEKE